MNAEAAVTAVVGRPWAWKASAEDLYEICGKVVVHVVQHAGGHDVLSNVRRGTNEVKVKSRCSRARPKSFDSSCCHASLSMAISGQLFPRCIAELATIDVHKCIEAFRMLQRVSPDLLSFPPV